MRLIVDKGSRQRVWENVERITVDRDCHNDKLCWELSEPEEIGCDNVVESWSEMCVGVESFTIEAEPGEQIECQCYECGITTISDQMPDEIEPDQHELIADGGNSTSETECCEYCGKSFRSDNGVLLSDLQYHLLRGCSDK